MCACDTDASCPRPQVLEVAFRLINHDSSNFFGRVGFEPAQVKFYPEDQLSNPLAVGLEDDERGPYFSVERFNRHDFYTIIIGERQYQLWLEFVEVPDPENTNCTVYTISKIQLADGTQIHGEPPAIIHLIIN